MERDANKKPNIDDEEPIVEILCRQGTTVKNVTSFVKDFIDSEEKLLESEKEAHAQAIRELEEVIASEGYDPEFQPDFASVQVLRAQKKVFDSQPTVDEAALRRLDKLHNFFYKRMTRHNEEEEPKHKKKKSKKHKHKNESRKSFESNEEKNEAVVSI